MVKPSRNAPCPCGSGKKYKKCCLRDDQVRAPAAASPVMPGPVDVVRATSSVESSSFSPGLIAAIAQGSRTDPRWRDLGLNPYAVAKTRLDPRGVTDPGARRAIERHRRGWTREKVNALSTAQLEARLATLGVAGATNRLLAAAADTWSAWEVAEQWIGTDLFTGGDEDVDFLGFAACELWRRLVPERPSIEMLDDTMQGGYQLAASGSRAAACDLWWSLWQVLRSRFTSEMRTVNDAEPVFSGVQLLGNWLQDFEMGLQNAAGGDRRFAEIGRQFCEDRISQFTLESDHEQVNVRRALAMFLFDLDRPAEAESLLLVVVERWPRNPWGYIDLSDAHAHTFHRKQRLPRDLHRARAWLERGLRAVGGDPSDRSDLEERLAEVRRAQQGRGDRVQG